jgi:hypothetical protein
LRILLLRIFSCSISPQIEETILRRMASRASKLNGPLCLNVPCTTHVLMLCGYCRNHCPLLARQLANSCAAVHNSVTSEKLQGLWLHCVQERFGSFAGIGVRIEDDIVCTKSGAEVMSAGVPTDPDEVLSVHSCVSICACLVLVDIRCSTYIQAPLHLYKNWYIFIQLYAQSCCARSPGLPSEP